MGEDFTTIRAADGSSWSNQLVECNYLNNFSISGMTLDGNGDGVTISNHILSVSYCQNFTLSDLHIKDAYTNGILVGNSFHGTITRITSNGTCHNGHPLTFGRCFDIQTSHCVFEGSGEYGFDSSMSTHMGFSDIDIYHSDLGFKITGTAGEPSEWISIDKVHVHHTVHPTNASVSFVYTYNSVITNLIIDNVPRGMWIESHCDQLTFDGLVISDTTDASLQIAGSNIKFIGYVGTDLGGTAMYLYPAHNITFDGMILDNCPHCYLEGSYDIDFVDCTLSAVSYTHLRAHET